MALAPLLYNITFDSQTRILYFWDKAGHELYHCEIPSPAPSLPTVSVSGDFGENNWMYCNDSGRNQQVSPNGTIYVYSLSGSASWDDTKSYAVLLWATYQSSQGRGSWGFSVEKGSNNNFYARNISSDTMYLYCLRCAVCSDSSATVITVYDSSNNPYNAFKYTANNTDYYYVLDGTQTDWTDDLDSIGYSLTIHAFTAWLRADKSPGMYTGSWHELYGEDGNYILLPGISNDQLSVVDWFDENDNAVVFPPSVSDRGALITSMYSDSRLMFTASSWPYPYTAPSMLTRITYVINQ